MVKEEDKIVILLYHRLAVYIKLTYVIKLIIMHIYL